MLLKRLGKYEIIEWLGGGRFGDVFLAYDTIIEAQFALKISRMRREEIVMLRDEAKLLASLNHPNIVRFYNIDIIDNKFVLVMEYIRGRVLREIIKGGGIEVEQAKGILSQTLEAISYAHNLGVLHRDLKPENILLTEDNIVKITDFGLARFIKSGSLAASTAGTPIYMAPEAWAGSYSEKSDIWSIGVILYELLTGIPPFLDDSLDGLKKKILSGSLLVPRLVRSDIPDYLDELIIQCLNPTPGARPNANEILRRLKKKTRGIKIEKPAIIATKKPREITLSPDQEAIINSIDGKLLVLGQAGCGKTTTLIYSLRRLIERGVSPSRLLVCAFTNKAANDIKERLGELVSQSYNLWIGTFHTLALRILRRDGERIDISEDFVVEEPKRLFSSLDFRTGKYRLNAIIKAIGLLKARGITPEGFKPQNQWEEECLRVYKQYQAYLKENNILDYDDLIIYATELLKEFPDLREFYQELFEYLFVDELQDINLAQYNLISLLVKNSFFFTGDEDQAIYGWRGADKKLLYRVPQDFPETKVFNLNRSFRLAQSILDVANCIMHRDTTAIPNLDTADVIVYAATSPDDEIDYIVREMKELLELDFAYKDIAILYRMNYLSRGYEEGLRKAGIPYTLISGVSFPQVAELKPIMEYLEMLAGYISGEDRKDFSKRAIAVLGIKKRAVARAEKVIEYQTQNLNLLSPYNIIREIIALTKLKGENINQFLEFAKNYPDSALTINRFLSELKLVQEMDLANWTKDTVKLMTVHSAKGMEFPVVFLVDLTEDIFPMTKSLSSVGEIEEERRLCYVAITRAQKRLYLLYPKYRAGRQQLPSRFLIDILQRK